MSEFKILTQKMQEQFTKMSKTGKLFRSELSGQQVWDLYLSGFKPNENPVFRDPESSSHNCNNDKNFIRRYGNIVAIDPETYDIITMFDINVEGTCYQNTIPNLSNVLKDHKITDVFFETFEELNHLPYEKTNKQQSIFQLGVKETFKKYTKEEVDKFGVVNENDVYNFGHFHVFVDKFFVSMTKDSVESIMAGYRDNKNVFKRGLDEISLDTFELVRDLIQQGSLLNGDSYLSKIQTFIPLKEEYNKLSSIKKDNWCWLKSYQLPIAKFRNELIGTLCVELSEGLELNEACKNWNKRVDPVNYMKVKSPITANQIKEAKKFVEENGYEESFDRRFATIEDIKASEILHINSGDGKVKTVSVFDNVKPTTSTMHKRSQFDGIEEVTIDKFMKDILPSCKSVEAFIEGRFEQNLVTLTTSKNNDSKQIFKWDNNYSWTYKNNLAGKSMIKEAVRDQGGKVDGVLRFSIMWSDDNSNDNSDLDAHCIEPDGTRIYYGSKVSYKTKGNLDIDITQPISHKQYTQKPVVENITYPDIKNMINGEYKLFINQYRSQNSNGFKAEIEFNGDIYSYEYNGAVSGNVPVATVTLKNGVFEIKHHLKESESSKEIWNIETNKFHKVNLMCLSPNFWGNNKNGNKHYMFMLEGCKPDSSLRSFHNENLNNDLLSHRKVMDVLGNTTLVEPNGKAILSGIGFNATVKDELILKLSGSHKRTVKIKF